MVYFLPRLMKCSKCGHEGEYSQSEPPTGFYIDNPYGMPCPVCYANMIRAHCGMMQEINNEVSYPVVME